MRIVALLGSPRKNGNSEILTDEILSVARAKGVNIEKYHLDDYNIRPIGEVIDNSRLREDNRSDDDFLIVFNTFLDADIVIWATPVYWFGVSAQMKCFIDRLSSYFNVEKYKSKFIDKGHIVLCTYGRSEEDHGDFVLKPMENMISVIRGKYLGGIKVASCYQKGVIKDKKDMLKKAKEMGEILFS